MFPGFSLDNQGQFDVSGGKAQTTDCEKILDRLDFFDFVDVVLDFGLEVRKTRSRFFGIFGGIDELVDDLFTFTFPEFVMFMETLEKFVFLRNKVKFFIGKKRK